MVQEALIEVLVKNKKTLRSVKKFGIPRGTLKGNVTKPKKQNMDIELIPLIFFFSLRHEKNFDRRTEKYP